MPINRLIEGNSFSPSEIERLQEAYAIALRTLCLVDRNDPLTELVARKIIQVGQTCVDDPAQLSSRAIQEMGLQ